MRYSIAIHKDEKSSYGVIVPDLPGCFSYGDTIDNATQNAKEAIVGHIATLRELGEKLEFNATSIETLKAKSEFKDAVWRFVEVDQTA